MNLLIMISVLAALMDIFGDGLYLSRDTPALFSRLD